MVPYMTRRQKYRVFHLKIATILSKDIDSRRYQKYRFITNTLITRPNYRKEELQLKEYAYFLMSRLDKERHKRAYEIVKSELNCYKS